MISNRPPNGTCVSRWVSEDSQRGTIMFQVHGASVRAVLRKKLRRMLGVGVFLPAAHLSLSRWKRVAVTSSEAAEGILHQGVVCPH